MARKGENLCVDHPELKACPSFNLTFCSMFDVTNDYPKIPPTYPLCFCKKPVRIIDTSEEDLRIYFGCQNTVMDRPKCSWLMLGRDIAFPRQKHTIHQYVDEDTYFKNKQDKLDMIKKNRHLEQIQEAVMKGEEKLKGTTEDKAKHKMNTASNRVETTVNMLDKAENKKEMSTAGRETLDTHKLDLLFTLLKPPSTTTPQYYDMSSLTSLSNQYPSTYKHAEDTTEISALKSEIEKISNQLKEKDIQLKKMTDLKRSLDRLSNENSKLQTEIYYIQSEKDDEMISRISCQERLSSIDLDIVELMTENEKLMAEIDTLKGVPTVNENLKCKVSYCHLCVSRLTECAICRQQSTGIQKIYLC
ncbi:hypothetical protein BDB01DRAFT_731072 [Pilobolus umbonatus]|nr:hypothetical protein BDB01DRAFT_731072 [Pilobolus umbonatus]